MSYIVKTPYTNTPTAWDNFYTDTYKFITETESYRTWMTNRWKYLNTRLREFNCKLVLNDANTSTELMFNREEDYTWFVLRWS